MEASTLSFDPSDVANGTIEQQPVAVVEDGQESIQPSAELRLLMDLADHYARRLVAAADSPSRVLMLVHGNDLEIITLDDSDADVRALPQLLAQLRPSSAALVAIDGSLLGDESDELVVVVGETMDGQRDERRFRLRACGRRRRLTRLPDPKPLAAPLAVPRLFPTWTAPLA